MPLKFGRFTVAILSAGLLGVAPVAAEAATPAFPPEAARIGPAQENPGRPLAVRLRTLEREGPDHCLPAERDDQQAESRDRRRHSRMFGWLWRSTRNVDLEKTGTPLLFYLRSPLLSALSDRDCPQEEERLTLPLQTDAATCATIALNAGSRDALNVVVGLPQMDAATPTELEAALRVRLERGERVVVRGLGGTPIRLNPDEIRRLDAKKCAAEA